MISKMEIFMNIEDPNFCQSFNFVIGVEGGYVMDPNDRGGETKWGISRRAYPELDIKNLTIEDAKGIYMEGYWIPCQCASMSYEAALSLFDCAINMGCSQSIKIAQELLSITQDGIMGNQTLESIKNYFGNFLLDFNTLRILKYSKFKNFEIYGKGWIKRVLKLINYVK